MSFQLLHQRLQWQVSDNWDVNCRQLCFSRCSDGADYGSDYGCNYGGDYGCNYGGDYGSNYGSNK
jgi:hypothetical protein